MTMNINMRDVKVLSGPFDYSTLVANPNGKIERQTVRVRSILGFGSIGRQPPIAAQIWVPHWFAATARGRPAPLEDLDSTFIFHYKDCHMSSYFSKAVL
jgi:hypothetical protein